MKDWTKDELRVCPYKYLDLAAAVIRRWQIDGRPKTDEPGIRLWKQVIEASRDARLSV